MSFAIRNAEFIFSQKFLDLEPTDFPTIIHIKTIKSLVNQETLSLWNVLPQAIVLHLDLQVSLPTILECDYGLRTHYLISPIQPFVAIWASSLQLLVVHMITRAKSFREFFEVKWHFLLSIIPQNEQHNILFALWYQPNVRQSIQYLLLANFTSFTEIENSKSILQIEILFQN